MQAAEKAMQGGDSGSGSGSESQQAQTPTTQPEETKYVEAGTKTEEGADGIMTYKQEGVQRDPPLYKDNKGTTQLTILEDGTYSTTSSSLV